MQPRIGLIICASQRTGSGLLGSALWSTGVCGRPDEYFSAAARREYARLVHSGQLLVSDTSDLPASEPRPLRT